MSWINIYMFAQAILAGTLITSLLGARRRIKTQDIQLDCYEQKTERWEARCTYLARELRAARSKRKNR